MGLLNKEREYAKIYIEYDSKKEKQGEAIIQGDETTISSIIGALIHNLIISGFDRELLEYAILKALKDSEKSKSKNIKVHEIHISKDNEKELEEVLRKIVKGDK